MIVTFPEVLKPFYCDDLVRIGKDHDGGYLVNRQDILKTKKLITLGVGEDWSFEKQFIEMSNCSLDAYDGSVDINDPFFTGNRKFIKQNVNNTVLKYMLNEAEGDTFFKCDVEGDEYNFLETLLMVGERLTGMVIEFHGITNPHNFNMLASFVSQNKLNPIHIHVNNNFYYTTDNPDFNIPDVIELTFSSSPNVSTQPVILPNPLDMPNHSEREDFAINFNATVA